MKDRAGISVFMDSHKITWCVILTLLFPAIRDKVALLLDAAFFLIPVEWAIEGFGMPPAIGNANSPGHDALISATTD